ncbi:MULTISPECIES: hypothetical protein [unclassified Variovorax]|uniref:hypothetical protein n=1 Tax=unclassified Variovorax TaxID=663243 RepID=UPI001BD56346|nr:MULTISPECIES: hypothetical protein [unclassified Variovorax]
MTRFEHFIAVAIAITGLSFAAVSHAQVYKCASGGGPATYSDHPCSATQNETLDLKYRVDKTVPSARPVDHAERADKESALKPVTAPAPTAAAPAMPARLVSQEDNLAEQCVDHYRKHLAYPQGVKILGRKLERTSAEIRILVDVRTISSPATPVSIDPIFINEKFICFSDDGSSLNERNTRMYSERHKKGERL